MSVVSIDIFVSYEVKVGRKSWVKADGQVTLLADPSKSFVPKEGMTMAMIEPLRLYIAKHHEAEPTNIHLISFQRLVSEEGVGDDGALPGQPELGRDNGEAGEGSEEAVGIRGDDEGTP